MKTELGLGAVKKWELELYSDGLKKNVLVSEGCNDCRIRNVDLYPG